MTGATEPPCVIFTHNSPNCGFKYLRVRRRQLCFVRSQSALFLCASVGDLFSRFGSYTAFHDCSDTLKVQYDSTWQKNYGTTTKQYFVTFPLVFKSLDASPFSLGRHNDILSSFGLARHRAPSADLLRLQQDTINRRNISRRFPARYTAFQQESDLSNFLPFSDLSKPLSHFSARHATAETLSAVSQQGTALFPLVFKKLYRPVEACPCFSARHPHVEAFLHVFQQDTQLPKPFPQFLSKAQLFFC